MIAPHRMRARHIAAILTLTGLLASVVWLVAAAQSPVVPAPRASQQAASPRPAPECCGYPYPRSLDAEIADADVHRVLYEDRHIMFLEVANPPLLSVNAHGHPFISVFANDSDVGARNPAAPRPVPGGSGPVDPDSEFNDMGPGIGAAPDGLQWPT